MASAPPNGRVLATSDPARLTVSARVWVIPGSAPVIVKVNASSAQSCRTASRASPPTGRPLSGSRISAQPTPATLGRPQDEQHDGERDRDDVAHDAPPHPAAPPPGPRRPPPRARHQTVTELADRRLTAPRHGRPRRRLDPPVEPALSASSGSAAGAESARAALSVRAVTVIDVPPLDDHRTTATDGGRDADAVAPAEPGDRPADAPRWLRRLFGYCWRHPVITLLAGLSAVGGVGLGALTPLLTQVAVDDATAGTTDQSGVGDRRPGRPGADPVRVVVPAALGRRPAVPRRPARHAAGRVRCAAAARRLRAGPAAHRPGGVPRVDGSADGPVAAGDGPAVGRAGRAVRRLAGDHAVAVAAAHGDGAAGGAGGGAGHQGDPDRAVPGDLGGPAVGRRGRRDRRGGRHRGPGGEGLRPGGPRARSAPRRAPAGCTRTGCGRSG